MPVARQPSERDPGFSAPGAALGPEPHPAGDAPEPGPDAEARRGARGGGLGDGGWDEPASVPTGESLDDSLDETASDADDEGAAPWADEDGGSPDYFATLGLAPGASTEDVRRAYLRLAKLWHPDRYRGAPARLQAQAERRMRQLNEAYAALHVQREYSRGATGAPFTWGSPVGDVRDVFGGTTAAYHWPAADDEHGAAPNPNGASELFAALALILALALIGGVVSGRAIGPGFAVVALFAIATLGMAAVLFTEGTPIGRWARATIEGESSRANQRGRGRQSHWAAGGARGAPNAENAGRGTGSAATHGPAATTGAGADGAQGVGARASGEDDAERFAGLVDDALDALPQRFKRYLENVTVRIEDEPSPETLREAGVPEGYTLLGLYQGVALTKRGIAGAGPDVITIFRGPIERRSGGAAEGIRRQTRATVLHELAHHFGIDHDDMPEWVK